MSRPVPDRRARGFTLIELLVAIFIAAIMFAIGYGVIMQALRARGAIREDQHQLLALQTALRIMGQDFVQLAPRPIRSPNGQGWQPALLGNPSTEPLVVLTRGGWSNPLGLQRPELERVAYLFKHGTLIREHWNVLDPTLEDHPSERDLLKHVKDVQLRYLNLDRQWLTQWPPPAPGAQTTLDAYYRLRPLAVEVTLDTRQWGKIVRIFEIAG
ncbi:MAG: type II secretion system minor pseudopilin GspJ [Steroidobacteraceae bacterium]